MPPAASSGVSISCWKALQERKHGHFPGVPARLGALGLDQVDPGRHRVTCCPRAVHLGRDQDASGVQEFHITGPDRPERQGHQRGALRNGGLQQFRAVGKRPCGQAHSERQHTAVAGDPRLLSQRLDRHLAADPEHAKAAGLADGPGELPVGHAGHRCADHRIPDTESLGQPRCQHSNTILPCARFPGQFPAYLRVPKSVYAPAGNSSTAMRA